MNKREERVINAFINCVNKGEFTFDYAVVLIESNEKYGYLSDEAKEIFYNAFAEPTETEETVNEEILND
ncbi:MAG: hypothetical protein IJ332_02400 [Clostridia bacterium]|nr:hypothetical protein [Clostridia bacterium]